MKERWERLFGLCLPARLWEEEVFPARLDGYSPRWLDTLFGEAGLLWFGAGKERVGFCFGPDAELYIEGASKAADAIFPGRSGKHGFWELVDFSKMDSGDAHEEPLGSCLEGRDIRGFISTRAQGHWPAVFEPEESAREGRGARGGFARWQSSRPSAGSWFRVPLGKSRGA